MMMSWLRSHTHTNKRRAALRQLAGPYFIPLFYPTPPSASDLQE